MTTKMTSYQMRPSQRPRWSEMGMMTPTKEESPPGSKAIMTVESSERSTSFIREGIKYVEKSKPAIHRSLGTLTHTFIRRNPPSLCHPGAH
jgi:hypothetical protein